MVPVVALCMAASGMGGQGGDQPLTVSVVRFYSPARATTTIEGVCEVRLDALGPGTGSAVRYRFEVSFQDSTGLELQHNGWTREVPAAVARMSGATAVETFEVPVAPGRYQLVVRVVPDGGASLERTVSVSAYAARPLLSDVLLATSARSVSADSEVGAGEVRRGALAMRTAPTPRFSPTDTTLAYYAEVYPGPSDSLDAQLSVAVVGAQGRSVVATPPRSVRFPRAGGVTDGSLDLAGLAPGAYRFEVRVRVGDSTVVGSAPFVMTEAAAVTAQSAGDVFDRANELQLDSMYAPMVYLLEPNEQGVYDQLSVDGKRRFLREAWAKRDPAHGAGGVNQAMVRFYRAVDFANRAFREGGAGQVPGWRTDRGRIYLLNGQWDDILRRPAASPAPYEVWKYTRGRQRYYVFWDESGMGVYRLILTNDRHEVGVQNWGSLLGTEDSIDVVRYLGLSTVDQPQ